MALPVGVGGAASVASSVLKVVLEAAEEGPVSSSDSVEVGRGVDAEFVDAGGRPELMGADDGRAEEACGFGVCIGTSTLVALAMLLTLATLVALPPVVLVAVAAAEDTPTEDP